MISETVEILSDWQLAIGSTVHILTLPLTLGLSLLIALFEMGAILHKTTDYRLVCQFWRRVLAINLSFAVAIRLITISNIGLFSSYFAHYLGDIYALPLLIDTFGLFFSVFLFFGYYNRQLLKPFRSLLLICLISLFLNGSTAIGLVAEAWLQKPVSAAFNFHAYRIELTDLNLNLILNNKAIIEKVLHTLLTSYLTTTATALAISAWFLINKPKYLPASTSFRLALGLGLITSFLLILVDSSLINSHFNHSPLNSPNQAEELSVATQHIENGINAYRLLESLRDENKDPEILAEFTVRKSDLGYAWLLKRWQDHITNTSTAQIDQIAHNYLAKTKLASWQNQAMTIFAIISFLWLLLTNWTCYQHQPPKQWLLKAVVYLAPLFWLISLGDWLISKIDLLPWAANALLPTFLTGTSLVNKDLVISVSLNLLIYAGLIFAVIYLIYAAINQQLNLIKQTEASKHDS